MLLEALLLGLSSGTYCIIGCAPIAVPVFFSEGFDRRKNLTSGLLFLAGRLAGYLIIGAVIGALGSFTLGYLDPVLKRTLSHYAALLTGLLLIATGLLHNFPALKLCRKLKKVYRFQAWVLIYGLLTGLHMCPPFFAAAARVYGGGDMISGMLYFLVFFVGTSVYFLPLFGIHLIKKYARQLMLVARTVILLMGVYFFLFLGVFNVL
jgi:sulfite exporter TauE/SafE